MLNKNVMFSYGPIFNTSWSKECPAAQPTRIDRAAGFRRSGATQPEANSRTSENVGGKRPRRIGLASDEIIRGRPGHAYQSSNGRTAAFPCRVSRPAAIRKT